MKDCICFTHNLELLKGLVCSLVLEENGFARFKIKNVKEEWMLDLDPATLVSRCMHYILVLKLQKKRKLFVMYLTVIGSMFQKTY